MNGSGRGRFAEKPGVNAPPEEVNPNSFTVGTWENSEFGKQENAKAGGDDWDMDEWDGSLTQTQVFERSNAAAAKGEKVPFGAIGAKPAADGSGIRVTLDNVMNLGGGQGEPAPATTTTTAPVTKSPRREQGSHQKHSPQKPQQRSQQPPAPTSSQNRQEPPVVILDNRVKSNSTVQGLRFGCLDSMSLTGNDVSKPEPAPAAAPAPKHAQQRAPFKPASPFQRGPESQSQQQQHQASPVKQDETKFAPKMQQQQQQPAQGESQSFRSSAAVKPEQPRVAASFQQQQPSKINGSNAEFPGQTSQTSQMSSRQQPSQQNATSSSNFMNIHQGSNAPLYSGSNQQQQQQQPGATKLSESMSKLNVQEKSSPQRPQQQQQQPPQQQQQSQQQQNFSSNSGQNSGTMPFYFPQYPASSTASSQQQQQQQPTGNQTGNQNQPGGNANDYFNNPDMANLYARLDQQAPQQQQNILQQGGGANGGMKDSRMPSAEQMLQMTGQPATSQANVPPHSSAAGLPPGVPPAYLTPQLFYPLMQLFATNPNLIAPFLTGPQAVPPPTADIKSQAQFLQAVGMSAPFYAMQQQQGPAVSLPDDAATSQASNQGQNSHLDSVVGQPGSVGQQQQQQQQQQHHHQANHHSIRPPPGFVMPTHQRNPNAGE